MLKQKLVSIAVYTIIDQWELAMVETIKKKVISNDAGFKMLKFKDKVL